MHLLFKILCAFCLIGSQTTFGSEYIENFAETNKLDWIEHSDTVRDAGKSKASMVIQESKSFRGAVLFALLNPQPCGAAFAGFRKLTPLDLTPFGHLSMKIKGQGQFNGYMVVLQQKESNFSFCSYFKAPKELETVSIPFNEFKPHFEGKIIDDPTVTLDKAQIRSIGIMAYGGRYRPEKQSGVGSLEIACIKGDQ